MQITSEDFAVVCSLTNDTVIISSIRRWSGDQTELNASYGDFPPAFVSLRTNRISALLFSVLASLAS